MAEIRNIYRLNVNNEPIQPGDEDNPKHFIKRPIDSDFIQVFSESKLISKNQVLEETLVPNYEQVEQSVLNEYRDQPLN